MINLNLLETFKKVADCGSLTKAARQLKCPKSKVSRDLVKLEEKLEQTLMNRSPRGIILNDHGLELLRQIRKPLEELNGAIDVFRTKSEEINGTIKLTAPEDLSFFILTPLITEFMSNYPDIKIELYSTNTFLDFNKHSIDLALRIGKLEDSNLIQRKITDINVVLMASNHYLKGSKEIRAIDDLEEHSVAVMRTLYGDTFNKKEMKNLEYNFSSNSIPVLKNFVKDNRGVATIPEFLCKKEIATKEFVHILPKLVYSSRSLFILSRSSQFIPKHVKIFKDFLFENLKKEL